ncbi:MAG: hypothetical protein AB8B83_02570 [Bdellovibrionales bacterium]
MKLIQLLIVIIISVLVANEELKETSKEQQLITASKTLSEEFYWLTEEEDRWLCNYKNSYKGKPPSSIQLPSGKTINYKWAPLQSGPYKGSLAAEPVKPIKIIK